MDEQTTRMDQSGVRRTPVLAWMRLARVFQKVHHASTEQLSAWNLSLAQFDVLAQVGAAEGSTQQELAERLLVTKGNVSQLLTKMERAGLIIRRREGRVRRIYLTDGGRQLFDTVVPRHEDFIAGKFARLSPEEQSQLLGLLRKLDRALEDQHEPVRRVAKVRPPSDADDDR
ncbi:MarR family winged helix-turn-helix transcriptional regulator [Nitrolancea hollandica]|uniref:Transcriptional regulator, MarR family (Modular protein) n=1 Tax=Nitrolancea hollandica Lb TaxID=1129897 RepID=I4EG59_9BACT|nr:MarR family transcriptional regulator [Nitrolancea hollandica]CCF83671.1 Transcriptional regulator, MarR family (modular protein) [Nitrolancea hollandica Lb]